MADMYCTVLLWPCFCAPVSQLLCKQKLVILIIGTFGSVNVIFMDRIFQKQQRHLQQTD